MGVLEPDKNHKPKPSDNKPDPKKDPRHYDKDGKPIYPSAKDGYPNGFDGPPKDGVLQPGAKIDRFGTNPDGKYFSDVGTPFENRAMPGSGPSGNYAAYEVLKPIPMQSGKIAPWFGQPGGGMQYYTQKTLKQLLDGEYIRKIDVPFR